MSTSFPPGDRMTSRYGGLFQIDHLEPYGTATRLQRVELSGSKASSGYDEKWLQQLLAHNPQALPIAEIESFLEGAIPICLELSTRAGPIDLVLATPRGDIVLVECKLWRNPQARREVVGQIIDYAKELPRLSYETFEAAIRGSEPAGKATKTDSLYQRTGAEAAGVDEKCFIDAVARNLRRGRFLLLVVGDGIREGVESITEFLQQHAGMHFTLALVEVAIFKAQAGGYLVQPRVLAKTEMVPRGVVWVRDDRVVIEPAAEHGTASARAATPATISEARLYEVLDTTLPGAADRVRHLVAAIEDLGGSPRFTPAMIVPQGLVADRAVTLANIDVNHALVWFDGVVVQATAWGRHNAAIAYYKALVALLRDDVLRAKKLNPGGKTGTAGLPLDDLLLRHEDWLAAANRYLGALADLAQDLG